MSTLMKPTDYAVYTLMLARKDPVAAIENAIKTGKEWGHPLDYTLAVIELIAQQSQARALANA